ncbi:MAG: hypothetical protein HQ538_01630 [Parcubacteria group bacterium]|nr:hypothetical protein [Parcubacteria group bacterium]
MSKNKKKKTKEQKKKAIINRQKYLFVMNKPETALKERHVELAKEGPKAIQKAVDTKAVKENEFTIFNIKRSIVYALVFFVVIFGLYFLELQMHYFSDISNNIVFFLTK